MTASNSTLACFLGVALLIGVVACDRSKSENQYETLTFNVDEQLLEPPITDSVLNISFSPPAGWEALGDTTLTEITAQLADKLAPSHQLNPRWIFSNGQSGSMCIVSKFDTTVLDQDKLELKELEKAYRSQFPDAKIQSAIFLKDGLQFHQLMVTLSQFVLIKLLLNGSMVSIVEFDYVVPRRVYAAELRAIESSIGSIGYPIK